MYVSKRGFFCLTKRVGAVVYHTQQGLLHLTSDSVRCAYLIRFQLAAMVPGTSKNIMMLIDHIDTCCSIEHKSWMKLVKQDVKMPHDTAEVQLLQVFWWLVLLGLLLEAPSITASPITASTGDSDLPQAAWRAYEIRLWAIKAPLNHGIPTWCWGQVGEKPYYTSVKG